MVGLDVFVESPLTADELGASLTELADGTRLELKMISSRGTKVYPPTGAMTDTRRPLAVPVHHPGEPRRPLGRGRAPAAGAHLAPAHLDAHREAAGVRRRARVHAGPGRELSVTELRLRSMTADEFRAYWRHSVAAYADDMVRDVKLSPAGRTGPVGGRAPRCAARRPRDARPLDRDGRGRGRRARRSALVRPARRRRPATSPTCSTSRSRRRCAGEVSAGA